MNDQKRQYPEVDTFLNSVSLAKYKETFIDNGVEDLETILEMDEKHLESMRVPLGHKLKMMKKIKQIRKEEGMDVVQPPVQVAKEAPVMRDALTELPLPNEGGGVGTSNDEEKKTSSGVGASNSLFDGAYDEEAERIAF